MHKPEFSYSNAQITEEIKKHVSLPEKQIKGNDISACLDELRNSDVAMKVMCSFTRNAITEDAKDIPRFEADVSLCRKELEAAGAKNLSRRIFKLLITLRKNDRAATDVELHSLTTLLSAARDAKIKGIDSCKEKSRL